MPNVFSNHIDPNGLHCPVQVKPSKVWNTSNAPFRLRMQRARSTNGSESAITTLLMGFQSKPGEFRCSGQNDLSHRFGGCQRKKKILLDNLPESDQIAGGKDNVEWNSSTLISMLDPRTVPSGIVNTFRSLLPGLNKAPVRLLPSTALNPDCAPCHRACDTCEVIHDGSRCLGPISPESRNPAKRSFLPVAIAIRLVVVKPIDRMSRHSLRRHRLPTESDHNRYGLNECVNKGSGQTKLGVEK